MGDDKKIILLSLELQDARFKTNCKIMIRLWNISLEGIKWEQEAIPQLVDIGDDMGPARATQPRQDTGDG
jgi:hypothetical protein